MTTIEQIRQPIELQIQHFEQSFADALRSDNPLLQDVLRYVGQRRGKQLRPLLVLLSAVVCREINEKTIQTAVALEILHTASLLHDDVVDESDLRRGQPTVNRSWSNKVAILSGDYLLSRVIELTSSLRNLKIMSLLSQVGNSLAQGELYQLQAADTDPIEHYMRIIEHKTASLFSICCMAGAVSSGATPKQEAALRRFGYELGICFQMQDDILDYSDSEELGKPTMHDIWEGKLTMPILIALQRATTDEQQHIDRLIKSLPTLAEAERFAAEQEIRSFVLRYDGIRYTQQQMFQHRAAALDALAIFHPSSALESLRQLIDYSINRLK